MPATFSTQRDIPHLAPIACSSCNTGKAKLIECRAQELDGDNAELWVFKCDGCGAISVVPVDK